MIRKKLMRKFIAFAGMILLSLIATSFLFMKGIRGINDHNAFYGLEKDSLDVLFVGASHSYCAFSPEVLLREYGLESYNLASANQSMLSNYLWAKEARRSQKYRTLVVECMSATMSHGDVENDIRSMHSAYGSPVYLEMAGVYKRKSAEVLFPILVLHGGFDKVSLSAIWNTPGEARGYVTLPSRCGSDYTASILSGDTSATTYLNFTYLEKIRNFCEENGIRLILVKTLMASNEVNDWNDGCHNEIAAYAREHGLTFVDFNEPEVMEDAGMQIAEDVAADLRHMNRYGAEKATKYIGALIGD